DQVYLDLLAGWREAWQRGDEARREAGGVLNGETAARAVTGVNGLGRERGGMATGPLRLDEPGGARRLTVPGRRAALAAAAENVGRHEDGSVAEVTLTFRATGVPGLGFRRYGLRPAPVPGAVDAAGTGGVPGTGEWADIPGATIENDLIAVTADPA